MSIRAWFFISWRESVSIRGWLAVSSLGASQEPPVVQKPLH